MLDLLGTKEIAVRAWDEALNTQPEKLIWNVMVRPDLLSLLSSPFLTVLSGPLVLAGGLSSWGMIEVICFRFIPALICLNGRLNLREKTIGSFILDPHSQPHS